MRIKINLHVKRLPILYRHRFIALIKEALNLSDYNYKSLLYPEKTSVVSKQTKPFTFSLYIPPGFNIKKEKFLLDQNLVMEETVFYPTKELSFFVSSSDHQFIVNLYNGLLAIKQLEIAEFVDDAGMKETEYMQISTVLLLNEQNINTEYVTFQTMSHISIEDRNDQPIELFKNGSIDPEALKNFTYHMNAIQDRRFKDLRGYGLKQPLVFVPQRISKKVVKHTLKDFRDQTGKPFMMLTTYHGTFILKGDPEDLQLTYQVGLGLRTGQGFGMLEVV